MLRSLNHLTVYPVAGTVPLPTDVRGAMPDLGMRLLRVTNMETYRYLVRDVSGKNGVIREVVLTGPSPGFSAGAVTDVAQVTSLQPFHVIESAPGQVILVIPELTDDGTLQITELDGSYDPASSDPVKWEAPRMSPAILHRPDGFPVGKRSRILGVTGGASTQFQAPGSMTRLFLNITDPDVSPASGGSFETWAFALRRDWLPGRFLGGPAFWVAACLLPRDDRPSTVSPAATLYCTQPQATAAQSQVPTRGTSLSCWKFGPMSLPLAASWWTPILATPRSRPRPGHTGSGLP